MVKMIAGLAAAALLSALALPGSASATDNRGDGMTNTSHATEVSSQRRRGVRRYYRYPRYGYRYGYRGYRYPRYYGSNYYAYAPYPYYRSYYGPRYYGPGFSFGFGW